MQVKATYRPGQKGTHKLVKQYGDKLVCVRYRYDYHKHKRYKTIELIIDENDWTPPPPHPHEEERPVLTRAEHTRQVPVRIGFLEENLQKQIKAIGGTWSRKEKLWYASEYSIKEIGLEDRIVKKSREM
ncbi:MAG TPA: hypothetical protein ENI65_02225 [Gammaproteobacteria bacterium]|nr:hypothetical protein [Gammaproteobacteria bacterium]